MAPPSASTQFVTQAAPELYSQLQALAQEQWMIFLAGLPGMGKSLLIHQLAHLAHGFGKTVHLLQWDVARPVFEAHPAGQPFPVIDGVTHSVIRKAVGLWARAAVAQWAASHPSRQHLLIGETPLVGGRLSELVRPANDTTEPLLTDPSCLFVIPVPSQEVRQHAEAERARRIDGSVHAREREDAPPHVMLAYWEEVYRLAQIRGLAPETVSHQGRIPYEPDIYRRFYETLLAHRHLRHLPINTILPTVTFSVYDFAIPHHHLVPQPDEVVRCVHQVQIAYPDLETLEREAAAWYRVS